MTASATSRPPTSTRQRDLFVPDNYRDAVFGFLQSSVVTKTDIGRKVTGSRHDRDHQLAPARGRRGSRLPDDDDDEASRRRVTTSTRKAAVESFFPLTPGTAQGNALDVLDRRFAAAGRFRRSWTCPTCWCSTTRPTTSTRSGSADEVTDVEWQKSLTEIAATKGRRFVQIDFSATPYNEVGTRQEEGQVSTSRTSSSTSISTTAMQAGLVKSLALDKRKEVAALPLDFKAERDETATRRLAVSTASGSCSARA